MTISIAARCPRTGMLGIAITTSSICVASRCPWAKAGIGAIVTQNITDPGLGPRGLDLLAHGLSADETIKRLVEESPHPEYRQLAIVDRHGYSAYYAGVNTLGTHDVAQGENCIALGNLLAHPNVPQAMVSAFMEVSAEEPLGERLLTALEEGLAEGGEAGAVRSAGLLVVDVHPWPLVDLRVDWHDHPVKTLRGLWRRYEPQINDFILRALQPDKTFPFLSPENS
jgi:uncharacterized Ntn-hydrolase superfamily protein